MTVRLSHRQKPDTQNYIFQALGSPFSLTGIAASLRIAYRMSIPDKIPYVLSGQSATVSKLPPVWGTMSAYSIAATTPVAAQTLPVTVPGGGSPVITVAWHSSSVPSTKPTWVTLTSGTTPTITFTGDANQIDSADVASMVISATANGQTQLSTGVSITVNAVSSDWAARIAGPDVVWYHRFDTEAELNNFRWTSAWGSGNDPQNLGGGTGLTRQTSGGPDGGPYISLYHIAAGPNYSGDPGTKSKWVRPFSPLTGSGNGRGQDDPAASNTLVPQTWTPTNQGSETILYDARQRSGYYGKVGYEAAGNYNNPSIPQTAKIFDGNDFYIQLRIKADPDRMASGSAVNGKFFGLTSMTMVTYSLQEIVTVSAYPTPTGVGGTNYHQMYDGTYGYLDNENGNIANSTGATWNPPVNHLGAAYGSGKPGWSYSGGWDTLLFHITPGTNSIWTNPGTWVKDTRIEVWAAHENVTSYTKIWDTYYRACFEDTFNDGTGRGLGIKYGWNAFSFFNYQNVDTADGVITNDFYQSIGQIIFSKSSIPCPGSTTALQQAAATMAAGEWKELVTNNFSGMLLPNSHPTQQSPIIEFTDKMAYDPIRKQIHLLGCARGDADPAYQCGTTDGDDAGYSIYDEASNTWSKGTTAPVNSAPHGYDHCAVNPANGDYYYITSGQISNTTIYYRAGGSTSWSTQSGPTSTGGTTTFALEIFPERSELTVVDGGDGFPAKLWTRPISGGSWTSANIGTFPSDTIGAYSCFSRYSAKHQCLYFGGGVASGGISSPNHLYKYTSAGAIVKCADPPAGVSLGIGGAAGRQCIDPRTGNLLFFSQPTSPGNGRVYSFNGTSWTQHSTHPLGTTSGNELISVFESHASAGVVMAVNWNGSSGSKVYLYRHT